MEMLIKPTLEYIKRQVISISCRYYSGTVSQGWLHMLLACWLEIVYLGLLQMVLSQIG